MTDKAKDEKHEMGFRVLGNTGIAVSALSYGFFATFGAKKDLSADAGVAAAKDCLRVARAGGINFFDNAETYGEPAGEAERIMGSAIQQLREEDPELWRRSDILVSTKIFWGRRGKSGAQNEVGLSRKHIVEGLDASLARLQCDYVDMLYCHRPDPFTATETVVRAMSDMVRQGKAMAWGTSEWSAQQITEAFYIAREGGHEPPQFEQPQYNVFERERFEKEYFPLYRRPYNLGTTIWGPLSSGLLTGKYNDGVPEGTRMETYAWLATRLDNWRKQGRIDTVRQLSEFAEKEVGCSVSQLSIAWCLKNPNVSTVLLGASNSQQMTENLEALQVFHKLTDAHMASIEAILGNKPEPWECQMRSLALI